MKTWTTIAVLAALTAGCAGLQTTPQRDPATGFWMGEISRDGWPEPFALNIARDGTGFRGAWRGAPELGTRSLEVVDVQGDDVRLETDKLRFVGHVSGDTLSGRVTEKPADAPVGEFIVRHEEPVHNPGSEWAPDFGP